jgi:hypothetical protein
MLPQPRHRDDVEPETEFDNFFDGYRYCALGMMFDEEPLRDPLQLLIGLLWDSERFIRHDLAPTHQLDELVELFRVHVPHRLEHDRQTLHHLGIG